MDFNSGTKMKDIALSNPAARQVLEDAGLDYCCGGGKSLHEACLHAKYLIAGNTQSSSRKRPKHGA